MNYTLKFITQDYGFGSGFVTQATVTNPVFTSPITKVLNGTGSCSLQFTTDDPVMELVRDHWIALEVQIYRGAATVPYWWGVIVNIQKTIGARIYTLQCAEVIPWLLGKRFFQQSSSAQKLTNPDFESGSFFGSWTTPGVTSSAVDSSDSVLGTYSADLQNSGDAPDAHVDQTFTITAGGVGELINVAAYFKVVSFTGPAFENRGLYVEWRDAGTLKQVKFTTIDGSTSQGLWTKAELPPSNTIWIPPGVTADVNVRGYSLKGEIRWDDFFAGVLESTSTDQTTGTDLATFAEMIVNHAQGLSDPVAVHDDLYIDTDCPATGDLVVNAFQHIDHENIWNALRTLIDRDPGIDIGYVYTASTRTLKTYSRPDLDGPGKGTDQTALDLTPYVVDYGYSADGNSATTAVTMQGSGTGPSRDEGLAYLGGDRKMEMIVQAPVGLPLKELEGRAGRVSVTRTRVGIMDLQFKPGDLIEGSPSLDTGDLVTVPVFANDPWVIGAFGDGRVVDLSLDPRNDSLSVGLVDVDVNTLGNG